MFGIAVLLLRMPDAEAPDPEVLLCNVCLKSDRPGLDLGCGSDETRHWFCSQCVVRLRACPLCGRRHPLCTGLPPRENQDEDLSMETVWRMAAKNIWASQPHISGGDSPDVEWLEVLENLVEPPGRAPWRAARWRLPQGVENPANWVPDRDPHDTVPQGSLPQLSELPTNLDVTRMNIESYRAVTLALTTRIFFAFSSLVGDAEWAMGIVPSSHSQEWGDFLRCSGRLLPGGHQRLKDSLADMEGAPHPQYRTAYGRASQPTARPPAGARYVWQCGSGQQRGQDSPVHRNLSIPELIQPQPPRDRLRQTSATDPPFRRNQGYGSSCTIEGRPPIKAATRPCGQTGATALPYNTTTPH